MPWPVIPPLLKEESAQGGLKGHGGAVSAGGRPFPKGGQSLDHQGS